MNQCIKLKFILYKHNGYVWTGVSNQRVVNWITPMYRLLSCQRWDHIYTRKVTNKKANVPGVGCCGDACFILSMGTETRHPETRVSGHTGYTVIPDLPGLHQPDRWNILGQQETLPGHTQQSRITRFYQYLIMKNTLRSWLWGWQVEGKSTIVQMHHQQWLSQPWTVSCTQWIRILFGTGWCNLPEHSQRWVITRVLRDLPQAVE